MFLSPGLNAVAIVVGAGACLSGQPYRSIRSFPTLQYATLAMRTYYQCSRRPAAVIACFPPGTTAADDARAVHIPQRNFAIGILPKDVSVAVEAEDFGPLRTGPGSAAEGVARGGPQFVKWYRYRHNRQ
jgi:hypothetical protein